MDIKGLKKLIKETVKEAIQEELKDILLEAVRAPKVPVGMGGYSTPNQAITETIIPKPVNATPTPNAREKYTSLLNSMMEQRNGNLNMSSVDAMSFTATEEYRPPVSANTAGEGSSLPPGEVNLNQIMGLMSKK
jgi:hypothetical protein